MRTISDITKFIRLVTEEHKAYWKDKSTELKKYRDSYETKFWQGERHDETMIRIETSDAHSYIEGFIASLFSKNPSVVIGDDLAASGGNAELAQAAANRFLTTQREQLENASRLGLIYDFAALKLCPTTSDEMLDRVSIKAIPCWEVIVDRDAASEEDSRFIGHCYYMTLVEAKEKFGKKDYTAVPKVDFFEGMHRSNKMDGNAYADLPDDYLYIEVVELYDLLHDEVYFWTPHYSRGEKLLERSAIPIRTYDDRPCPPLTALYYSRSPSKPMEGMSAMSRVYDQLYEKNTLRTYWANAVRRDSRQYLYREGSFDEEQLSKITAGIDGAMIGVDEQTLDGLIRPVEVTPISSNFDRYSAAIEADINRGSVLSPFRGEASRATATEITALAQYSASDIGKMAREKDNALERIIAVYLRMLDLLAEEGEQAVLEVDGVGKVITPTDFDGKFRIHAVDQGATPLSDAMRKQNLITLIPTLQALGVNPEKIKAELIRAYELPKDFLEPIPEAPAQEGGVPGASAADVENLQGGPMDNLTDAEKTAAMLGGNE